MLEDRPKFCIPNSQSGLGEELPWNFRLKLPSSVKLHRFGDDSDDDVVLKCLFMN